MFYKVYRKIIETKNELYSKARILSLSLKYPGITFEGNCKIGKNCHIICADGGKLILNNVYISNGVHIKCVTGAKIHLTNCYIGINSIIVSINKIIIKDNVEIAEMVIIRDQDHIHNLSSTPISKQGFNSAPIIINKNVWVGAKTTILKGVIIEKNSIIGAHSLVNKNIPISSIYAGTPAKPIFKND